MVVGATVKVFGKRLAKVTSVHHGGKKLGITWDDNGAATFVAADKCSTYMPYDASTSLGGPWSDGPAA